MVVAGDFAQLPPMSGPSLYSGRLKLQVTDVMDQRNQNAFSTVVILRENMRQQTNSPADNSLRTALENMRYVAGFRPEDPKLFSAEFRNVSIITARNSPKDMLNLLGAQRFAADNKQTLVEFYSVDRISSRSVDKAKWKGCEQSETKRMTKALQKKMWDGAPCTIPGKLSLCMANDATEMCITKGQEAAVVSWDESIGPMGQKLLDTLFFKLIDPPRTINIEGLPENIVPLVRTVSYITVLLEDDTLLSVLREHIVAMINFGMTDYMSQGKSRPKYTVDLANCRTDMSYYVKLSRGTTPDGTIIVQALNASTITSGISGQTQEIDRGTDGTNTRRGDRLPTEKHDVQYDVLHISANWVRLG
ncbi:hypothetical protein B0H17DRAFT_1162949 [Mycena rosella]|uniref:ATP-dependent DNA helicase n=1 Tax=Mycena rosella TaxID=1033263 RepID=A0AAD7CSU7_MYCRO|nr:hypothetical protein B0H17DRAFT_1162949 [Mycena rosella]